MKKRILVTIICAIVAVICGFCLAACGGKIEESLTLDQPQNVRYDGATITWNAVENADEYSVRINDGSEYSVTVASYPYKNTGNAQFNVTIKAVSKSLLIQSAETTKSFMPIDSITGLTVEESGRLVWDAITTTGLGSIEYVLKVDGKTLAPVTVTEYDIAALGAGRHTVQVCPQIAGNDSYYAQWSESKTVTVLGSVASDKITYEEGMLKWPTVSGALSYDIYIGGSLVGNTETNSYTYDAQSKSFDISIQPVGDSTKNVFSGEKSEAKQFVYLDTVTNITVENGILCWDEVEGADYYKIKLDGTVQTTQLTTNRFERLSAGRNYDIQIIAMSKNAANFSEWSASKNVQILAAPVLQWNSDYELDGEANSNTFWDAVNGAESYAVKLTLPDGSTKEESYGVNQRAYQQAFLEVGTYKVQVKSVGSNASGNVYDSQYSNPVTVTRLAAPKAVSSNYITSDPNNVTKGFTVTYQKVDGASGYVLSRDKNEIQRGTSNQFVVGNPIDSSVTEAQELNYTIRALGNVKTTSGLINVTLGSLTKDSLSFKISVLATPSNPDISGTTYSFGTVTGANNYTLDVQGKSVESQNTEYDLKNAITAAGVYSVKVCAKGNGGNVLASNYTPAITVHRLKTPTNIRISNKNNSEGQLTFDGDTNASSHKIVFDDTKQEMNVNDIDNMNQYITEQGTTVYMVSTANRFNDDNTIYYMDSLASTTVNFIKFAAPTFGEPAFNNDELVWKAPSNMNTQYYTPTYEVYDEKDTLLNGVENATRLSLATLESGNEYQFKIKAVGNETRYINSDFSKLVKIYKLATPQVSTKDGKYVWNSVSEATSYVVYIDGVVKGTFEHEAGKTYEFAPGFNTLKTHIVEVVAVGDGGYTTINSAPYHIEQKTKLLTTPKFEFGYSEKYYTSTGTININITDKPAYAKGYMYTIGDVSESSANDTYSRIPSGKGALVISVYALGGNFDENGEYYYLDSQLSGGTSTTTITLLGDPNYTSITKNADGRIKWAAVDSAIGYEIEIKATGVETFTKTVFNTYVDVDYATYKNKAVTITIRARGNNVDNSGNVIMSSTAIIVNAESISRTWDAF